jgi:RNA polymerase sigma-70 factor (ECF subfamily)
MIMTAGAPALPDVPARPTTGDGDAELVAALRQGDESAFATLVERYHLLLVRLALPYLGDDERAEEVVQETWLEVVRGIQRFEGRSRLSTWLCAIVVNRARTRATREARSIPFSALGGSDDASEVQECFDEAGWWASAADAPQPWPRTPEDHVLSGEVRACLSAAIATLPAVQRQVLTLRDVEGWSAAEVCAMLEVSEANQRVLLHRARSRARNALDTFFMERRGPETRPARS